MTNVFNVLKERGFIEQITHEDELKTYFQSGQVTCYLGFDPTAPSLHVGNLIPIMAMLHMQRNDQNPIILIGGATGCIGDPSGKTEIRKLETLDKINENAGKIKKQLIKFTAVKGKHPIVLDNADWLTKLEYIPFIRDVGRHFNVNRMIKAETYKTRMDSEEGLSFIEFNYMILQAYDFNKLYEKYNCRLQMGGSDQWGNIIAGINLVRRKHRETVFGMTFPLITNSSGSKMGKTVDGAVWVDPCMTSPYDYYQFWININDIDLKRFMLLFTFLPSEEIISVDSFDDKELNYAKSILAFETTCLAHGLEEAMRAYQSASTMFGERIIPDHIFPSSAIPRRLFRTDNSVVPSLEMDIKIFSKGIPAFKLFNDAGLVNSASSARRLIRQGGGYINGKRVLKFDDIVGKADIRDMGIMLRAGKKRFVKIKVVKISFLDKKC